jgi:hypothetical protein
VPWLVISDELSRAPNGYLRGCAKTEVALRDELSLSLRPRPAEFAAADRPHAKGPGPAVPTALDPVRGICGIAAAGQVCIFMQVDTRVPRYGAFLDTGLAPLRADVGLYTDQGGGRPDLDILGWSLPPGTQS